VNAVWAISCAIMGCSIMLAVSCAGNNSVHSDGFRGRAVISSEKKRLKTLVNVGDDIFKAKKKLVENGFVISYGPKLSNVQRNRYLMIVSYGVDPGPSAYVAEAMHWKGDGKPIHGTISADKSGRIFRIE
jgi:hypothetical protein